MQKHEILFMGQFILGALLKILGLEHKVLLNSVLHHLAS
jgi:hypothetical protein